MDTQEKDARQKDAIFREKDKLQDMVDFLIDVINEINQENEGDLKN